MTKRTTSYSHKKNVIKLTSITDHAQSISLQKSVQNWASLDLITTLLYYNVITAAGQDFTYKTCEGSRILEIRAWIFGSDTYFESAVFIFRYDWDVFVIEGLSCGNCWCLWFNSFVDVFASSSFIFLSGINNCWVTLLNRCTFH